MGSRPDRGTVLQLTGFDRELYSSVRDGSPALRECEESGASRLLTFPELLRDVWASLYKYDPRFREDCPKSLALNRQVLEKAFELPAWKELRGTTCLDEVGSALGALSLAEAVLALVPEEDREVVNRAARLEEEAERFLREAEVYGFLADAAEAAGDPARAAEMRALAADASARAGELRSELESLPVPNLPSGFRRAASEALRRASEDLEKAEAFAFSWGTGAGSPRLLERRERFELAVRLRSDQKLRKVADLAGRMRNVAAARQREKVKYVPSEVVGIKQGCDLSRVLPQELVRLRYPVLRPLFLRDFLEGKLLQYELKGREREGRGPLVVCVDCSGSMALAWRSYTREEWSKAVALALFWVAGRQRRAFACVLFGSQGELKVFEFPDPRSARPSEVAEMAAFFWGGGTDFESALGKARELLEKSEYRRGDVVFVTDGQARVSEEFLRGFLASKARKGFRVWAVLFGPWSGELEKFSDGIERVGGSDDRAALDMVLAV